MAEDDFTPQRARLPLLDRLLDDAPDRERDRELSASEAMTALRRAVRRDLENLLNARQRWRSWAPDQKELAVSPLGYGIPDFAAGVFADIDRRQALRAEIEATIKRFEPRFAHVAVSLGDNSKLLEPTLRLRVDALIHAEPAPEAVAFDTVVDSTTADVAVLPRTAD